MIPYSLQEMKLAARDCKEQYYKELMEWAINEIEKQLTIEELRSLYKYLEKQYLPYDDLFLHATVRKLGKIIENADKNDVAGQTS